MTGKGSDEKGAGRRRAIRIGITGPIGCGKSTIARWLGERPGVVVIDADQVARDVLNSGESALAAVVDRFGAALLGEDGGLDRAALGRLVFSDPTALRDLEAIVHPAVRPRILAAMEAADFGGAVAVIVEAIKLVEGGLSALCDEVWLVTCDPVVQRARLMGRGSTEPDAEQRIAAQAAFAGRVGCIVTRTIETSREAPETRQLAEAALDQAVQARRS